MENRSAAHAQLRRGRGSLRSAAVGRSHVGSRLHGWRGLLVLSGVLVVLGWCGPAAAQTTCTASDPAVSGFSGTLTDLVTDCATLLGLKDTLRGTGSLNWAATVTMAAWEGITVRGTPPRVTGLRLHPKNLTGTLPTALGSLTGLIDLDLAANELTGSIPTQLGSLTKLQWLDLHDNQLSGGIPADLGDLGNLLQLDLRDNDLTGSIPTGLADSGDLGSLKDLFLANNALTGAIPTQLGNLSTLRYLRLDNNALTGSIPTQLGGLSNLQALYLHANTLTGSIPAELGNLSILRRLYVHDTGWTGTVPPGVTGQYGPEIVDQSAAGRADRLGPESHGRNGVHGAGVHGPGRRYLDLPRHAGGRRCPAGGAGLRRRHACLHAVGGRDLHGAGVGHRRGRAAQHARRRHAVLRP